ncbi:MAG: LysR substrate-binding domain-containing protein, partial [Gammaproteobacteria bacterium]|nr:LysR substrate-binding domain-containing protein [Gammaproteobacteria bacterium]
MRLEIQHLRTLAALRDTESLRHAAERISVTPSAVSHQLKDLEDLVGQRLFVRKTHPVRFTPAGARLLALADAVLPEVRRALVDVDSLSEGLVEHLFINVEHHGPTRWLLAALEAYHHAWPKVAVDVPIASTLDPLPALARGDLDVVFTTAPIEDPALVYEPLFAVEIQIAVAPDHPRAAQEWFSPADLATETLISYPVRRSRLNVFTDFLEPAAV